MVKFGKTEIAKEKSYAAKKKKLYKFRMIMLIKEFQVFDWIFR